MTASGIDAQLAYVEESGAYGVYTAPTRASEFISEGIKFEIERIDSAGIRAGRKVLHRWAASIQRASGPIEFELTPGGFGLLLEHAMGTATTAGAGPYTHTYDMADFPAAALTLQVGRPDLTGTVQPFSYLGMRIPSWEITASVGEFAKVKLETYGAAEDTGEALVDVSAMYPTDDVPFVFTEGSLDIAASEVCIRDITLSGDNGLAVDRHFICSANGAAPKEPIESGKRVVSGTFTADFENLTQYNRFVNGTETAMVLDFTSGTSSFIVTMNVRFDGETPNVSGPELLELPVSFMAVSDTSDAAAFTAVLTNDDATP